MFLGRVPLAAAAGLANHMRPLRGVLMSRVLPWPQPQALKMVRSGGDSENEEAGLVYRRAQKASRGAAPPVRAYDRLIHVTQVAPARSHCMYPQRARTQPDFSVEEEAWVA
jgi:hypothetical protein